MTSLPVIARELQSQSRQPFTYWVRVLVAGALLVTAFLFFPDAEFGAQLGQQYFAMLHRVLFFSIWILVPMMAADCISRERRENTLSLLFLTALKPKDMVVAKSCAHGLRAITLCVSALPVFTICFLMGGVSWQEVFVSLTINFSSLCWALAAGILASSSTKLWTRALLSAEILSFIFGITFAILDCFICLNFVFPKIAPGSSRYYLSMENLLEGGFFLVTSSQNNTWADILQSASKSGQVAWMASVGFLGLLSLLALYLVVCIAARNVRRNWQDKSRSTFELWWDKKFCTPVVRLSIFKRWMKFKLERNPIGWLEVRTWSGRLVIWGWFATMISLLTLAFWDFNLYNRRFHEVNSFMAWLLAWSIASSAAGSFRRERETGVLELLLVAPLQVREIISGRLRGLWGQFLPAILLLLGVWFYWATAFEHTEETVSIWFFAVTLVTLPVAGLYFSLQCKNFIAALLRTLAEGIVLPIVLSSMLSFPFWMFLMSNETFSMRPGFITTILQILFAFRFWTRLHTNLSQRTFSLERAVV
jgi:hypothetical protein